MSSEYPVEFSVDILDSSGAQLGGGPILSASNWRYTARMDRAGDFAFQMPATDPKAAFVQKKRIVQATAILDGRRVLVGSGIIDHIERQPLQDGGVTLRVSGSDLTRELTYRTVLNLKLYDEGLPVPHATALTATSAFAPPGWTFTPDPAPPNALLYGQFNNNSLLDSIIKIADKSRSHFVTGLDRTLVFGSSFAPSGVRAIRANGPLAPETCAITSLNEIVDTHELLTRIYPRGSGNADVQLTLRATTRIAPAGYTLNSAENYIENTAAAASYGRIERQVDYREIGPIANTDADIQSAANALFDAALETLRRRSEELEQASYQVEVAECSQLLRPMQSIRVIYSDAEAGLSIDTNLNILEATWAVDAGGDQGAPRTTSMIVSQGDRVPEGGTERLADSMEQGDIYQALPQLNANSYTTAYTQYVDDTQTSTLEFDLGSEVTQLNQILLRFRLNRFESTVKSVGSATSGSGTIVTAGPSVNLSGSGGNDTSGAPSVNVSGTPSIDTSGSPSVTNTGSPSVLDTGAPSNNTSGGPNITSSGGPSTDTSGSPSVNTSGSPSVTNTGAPSTDTSGAPSNNTSGDSSAFSTGNTASNTGSVVGNVNTGNTSQQNTGDPNNFSTGTPNNNLSGTSSGDTGNPNGSPVTGSPTGGDTIGGGRHEHDVPVYDVAPTGGAQVYVAPTGAGGVWEFAAFSGNNRLIKVTPRGDHTHPIGSHSHDLGNHTHGLNNHTHTIGHSHEHQHQHAMAHTHTLAHTHNMPHTHSMTHTHTLSNHSHGLGNHSHGLGNHTHTLNNHSHTLNNHSHTLNNHSHNLGSHTHSLGNHSHSLGNHTHTLNAHTHTLNSHTHSLGNHTHDLSESIAAIYGIFREATAKTYVLADLEYRVNSGAWAGLETATPISSGRYELDLTAAVINATTLRPAQESNSVAFRRKASAVAAKTVMLSCQLKARTIIQSIALAA